MPEHIQRLFHRADLAALESVHSLNELAALGPVHPPQRTQFSLLVRHFLERFFNHETASASGEGKARLVLIACAAGLPGLMVAMYLWPVYHPFIGLHPGQTDLTPPYWVQANHHFFFVLYSFVATGLITVFEWDLFFPDLLDVFVLGSLPIPQRRIFVARIGAIAVFLAGFLFDANIAAWLVLPLSTDPPQILAQLAGHAASVLTAGIFAAGLVLAIQSTLLALLGERVFRRISLLLQGLMVAAFLILLLLFPVLSGITPPLLESNAAAARWFPPIWFLSLFQQPLPGAPSTAHWSQLAHVGLLATVAVWAVTLIAYPLAYLRRTRALVIGVSTRTRRNWAIAPLHRLLHATVLRMPVRRAVYHFISQTILRVPRYRIYLVLYGGVGVSLILAAILRLEIKGAHLVAAFSADGIRVSIPILAFWIIAGLRGTFVSPGNQHGGWIFRIVHGRPAVYEAALHESQGATLWVFLCAASVTVAAVAGFQLIAPAELRTATSVAAQLTVGLSLCLLLTDAFFLNVTTIPFTGQQSAAHDNLALTVMRYYFFFPFVTTGGVAFEFLLERGGIRLGIALGVAAVLHVWLRKRHRDMLRLECSQLALEEGEDDFLTRLGLRY